MKNTARKQDYNSQISEFEPVTIVAKRAAHIAHSRSKTVAPAKIPTEISTLDILSGGVNRRAVTLLLGGDGATRTKLAVDIACNIAASYEPEVQEDGTFFTKKGGVVGYYSLELSAERLATIILGAQTGISQSRIVNGNITDEEFAQLSKCSELMRKLPLFIDQTAEISASQISARTQILKQKRGLDVLIVDYIELLSDVKKNTYAIIDALEKLEEIADYLDVAVIAISESPRDSYEVLKAPRPYDTIWIDGNNTSPDHDFNASFYPKELASYSSHDRRNRSPHREGEPESNAEFLERASRMSDDDLYSHHTNGGAHPSKLAATLGGEKELGRSITSIADLARLVQDGLPTSTINTLSRLGFSHSEIEQIVAPRRTLARRREQGRLSPSEGDSVIRATRLLLMAISVFGRQETALSWLRTEQRTRLGGRAPMNLLNSEAGAEAVEEILLQALYGMTA
ncbi:DUF2384 domain-containing protein [Ensifer sp. MPMI2T]|nr:DUF2384 domain-containing protein [Ensifer sp. MPMI2T]